MYVFSCSPFSTHVNVFVYGIIMTHIDFGVISLLAFSSNSPSKNHYTSSTSEAVPPPTLSQNQAFSLPPGHVVCCFMDGGVGLYDMGAKKWDFLRDLVGKLTRCYLWTNKQ